MHDKIRSKEKVINIFRN